jgi:SRSO17 transposase
LYRLVKATDITWERKLDKWLEPALAALQHKTRRKWAPIYVRGLLSSVERKSVEPMAARVSPGEKEQLHHFVATSRWETAPLEEVLLHQANELVGGDDAHLSAVIRKRCQTVKIADRDQGSFLSRAYRNWASASDRW